MRKFLSFFLLVVLALNITGYIISFVVQREYIRVEMRRAEMHRNARTFTFTAKEYAQLETYEGGDEFSLNGYMYDVLSTTKQNDKVVVVAFCDHKETGLINRFVTWIESDSAPVKSKNTSFSIYTLLEFVFKPSYWTCFIPTEIFKLVFTESKILFLHLDTLSPPPDLG